MIMWIFMAILVFFVLILFLKRMFKKRIEKVCALCGAVLLTWIIFLILLKMNRFTDKTLLALLIGGSLVGLLYILEKKIPLEWTLFRVPFYLTEVLVLYSVLENSIQKEATLFVTVTWLIAFILFFYKRNTFLSNIAKKIVACCKNW